MALRAVTVFGSYRGPTGYDRHMRAFVRELHRRGIAVQLHDGGQAAGGGRTPPDLDPWFAALSRPVPARIALHFAMPNHVRPAPGLLNVNHTMFEATPAHPSWIALSRRHDLLLLPSESSRQAWLAGGMPDDRIRLCPLGVDAELYGGPAVPLPLRRDNGVPVAEYRVRFLNVSVAGPRKNLEGLLRAWIRATSRADDAILILKAGFYWRGAYEAFRAGLAQVERQLRRRLVNAAPVHLLDCILPDSVMPRLYAAATHYISMSHGEGWDLPMTEAGASGLRLIAPDHSGYRAYLDGEIADIIPSPAVPAQFVGDPYYSMLFTKARWWEPDEDVAVALIRAAIDGREAPKASARERILRDFSWERSTGRLIAVLSELDDRAR